MALRFLTILTGRNLPKILRPCGMLAQPFANGSAVAYFADILEKMGILKSNIQSDEPDGPARP
jgi:hypothetical protein